MLLAQIFSDEAYGLLVERLGLTIVAHSLIHHRQVVQILRKVRMVLSQLLTGEVTDTGGDGYRLFILALLIQLRELLIELVQFAELSGLLIVLSRIFVPTATVEQAFPKVHSHSSPLNSCPLAQGSRQSASLRTS